MICLALISTGRLASVRPATADLIAVGDYRVTSRVVRHPHRGMVLTPETTSASHFRITVRCGKRQAARPISITYGRYEKVWGVDWATIFEHVHFRCRCGSLADALKVERQTHDRPEEVLFVHVQTGRHCSVSG